MLLTGKKHTRAHRYLVSINELNKKNQHAENSTEIDLAY